MRLRRYWLVLSFGMGLAATLLSGTAHSQDAHLCSSGSRLETLGDLTLCIPTGHDRFAVKDHRLTFYWSGDEVAAGPTEATSADTQTLTTVVSVGPPNKQFEDLDSEIGESILRAAQSAGTAATFEVALAIRDGLDRVPFKRLEDGLLRGEHSGPDDDALVFLHPVQSAERPNLMTCFSFREKPGSSYWCLASASVAGQMVPLEVFCLDADAGFRKFEETVAMLRSFAVQTTP